MKTFEDHRRRQRAELPAWRQATTLGHGYVMLPHWAKPLWANTFRGERVAVREEGGKKGREREGEEQREEVEQKKKEKQGHREARSGCGTELGSCGLPFLLGAPIITHNGG